MVEIEALAQHDLRTIAEYLDETGTPNAGARFLDRVLERITALEAFPNRGSVPRELEAIGGTAYRQVVVGVNRIVYRVDEERVVIILVADGRRDMKSLFEARLFAG